MIELHTVQLNRPAHSQLCCSATQVLSLKLLAERFKLHQARAVCTPVHVQRLQGCLSSDDLVSIVCTVKAFCSLVAGHECAYKDLSSGLNATRPPDLWRSRHVSVQERHCCCGARRVGQVSPGGSIGCAPAPWELRCRPGAQHSTHTSGSVVSNPVNVATPGGPKALCCWLGAPFSLLD